MKQRAILEFTYESIIKMLSLPDEYTMQSIAQSSQDKKMEKFFIIISGPCLIEVPEGTPIPFMPIGELRERINKTQTQREVSDV